MMENEAFAQGLNFPDVSKCNYGDSKINEYNFREMLENYTKQIFPACKLWILDTLSLYCFETITDNGL